MIEHPNITVNKEVSEITVYAGQTLTVWLNQYSEVSGKRDCVQVEIIVDGLGTPLLLCNKHLRVVPFPKEVFGE